MINAANLKNADFRKNGKKVLGKLFSENKNWTFLKCPISKKNY